MTAYTRRQALGTLGALFATSVAPLGRVALAEAKYPAKPIQLIIPFAPGDTDMMLRPITDKMSQFLGEPLVMQYKPGAGGGIGAQYTANAKPDGYTLVGSSPGSLVIVPLANKEFKYSTESFQPVASLSEGGLMLLVPASSKYKSLKDVVADAKARPGIITYGSSGAKGITHLLAEVFAQEANIKLKHIPYQGSGPGITALLGAQTDMACAAIGPAQPHIKSGGIRALAVFSNQRLKAFPDVPTVKEEGYNVGSPTLYGIVAPKDTPPAVVNAIYEAARKAIESHSAQINENLATLGAEVKLLNPQDYGAYLQEQKALFAKAVGALDRGD
ncbi:Bug family tripartite tricarboxylate transporter substrate binding protein [Achromobacter aloeverae]